MFAMFKSSGGTRAGGFRPNSTADPSWGSNFYWLSQGDSIIPQSGCPCGKKLLPIIMTSYAFKRHIFITHQHSPPKCSHKNIHKGNFIYTANIPAKKWGVMIATRHTVAFTLHESHGKVSYLDLWHQLDTYVPDTHQLPIWLKNCSNGL